MAHSSRFLQIQEALMNRIDGLGITHNLDDSGVPLKLNIVIFKIPVGKTRMPANTDIPADLKKVYETDADGKPTFPNIQITQEESEQVEEWTGTDTRYKLWHASQIIFTAKDDLDLITNYDTYMYWREQVIDALSQQPLTAVSQVDYPLVRPKNVLDDGAWLTKDQFVSGISYRVPERRQPNVVHAETAPLR